MIVPTGVIAVVRASSAAECRTIVRGLIAAQAPAIELTMTVPEAVNLLGEFASSGVLLGAGTVLDPRACADCAAAGARFIVSPVSDLDVLDQARRNHVPYIGGALTPTEVLAAMRAGADAIKVFPAGPAGGASYLRALREPLPDLRAVPSGGIAAADVAGYFAAGAHAVCLGGALIDRQAARHGDVDAIAAHARIALEEISKAVRNAQDR